MTPCSDADNSLNWAGVTDSLLVAGWLPHSARIQRRFSKCSMGRSRWIVLLIFLVSSLVCIAVVRYSFDQVPNFRNAVDGVK